MTIRVLVISDRPDEYVGKRGVVKQQIVTVLDMEPGVHRLTQTFEYSLNDDEKVKYAGKLQDKFLVIGVREIHELGGRLRVRGSIVSVESGTK